MTERRESVELLELYAHLAWKRYALAIGAGVPAEQLADLADKLETAKSRLEAARTDVAPSRPWCAYTSETLH